MAFDFRPLSHYMGPERLGSYVGQWRGLDLPHLGREYS